MLTPNTVDLFSRFMASEFDEKDIVAVPTAFQSIFGKPGSQTIFSPNALLAEIDIIRANERIAALGPRGTVSRSLGSLQKNLNVEKSTSFSRVFPLSEEEGDITGDQILYRLAGENPYEQKDRLTRMRKLALKIHLESIRRTTRMFEVLASQSARTGKMDTIIGTANTDLQFDFKRDATLTVTPSTKWDVASTDILGDIDAMCDKIRSLGKVKPNVMFVGGGAMDAIINNTGIQTLADNRRFELVQISNKDSVPPEFSRYTSAGWNARGRLKTPKGYEIWLFTNVDGYTNSAGTFTPYMPVNEALITSTMARADRYFGPSEQLPMLAQRRQLYSEIFGFSPEAPLMPAMEMSPGGIIDPGMFYCDVYVAQDWKKLTVRTQSAPIFATTMTDAFGLYTGVLT